MSRYTSAARGTTTFDDVAVRSLGGASGGSGLGPNVGFFSNTVNPLATVATAPTTSDAAQLAKVLAQKTAQYLIEFSPFARNCWRLTVPAANAICGQSGALNTLNVAILNPSTFSTYPPLSPWTHMSSDPGFTSWGTGYGNSQLVFGIGNSSWATGPTFTVNPRFVLQSDSLIDYLARAMAYAYLPAIDGNWAGGAWAQFTSNFPLGTPGSAVSASTIASAISTIKGVTNYVPGMPITVVLGEQAALDLDTISSEPFPGFVAADHTGARRRIYTDGTFAEICFSENVTKTGTSPVVHHGVAFAPQAILLGSAPVVSPTQNPYSATPLTTSNVVSSTPVNNFISTVKFSLAASSGTGFDFNLCPNLAGGIGDNSLGVRIEGN